MEVFISYAGSMNQDDYYVLFQNSEGASDAPFLVKAQVDTKKETIEFVFPKGTSMEGKKFHGVISKAGMRVNIPGTGYTNEWLKRQPSYWEKRNRDCK